MTEEIWKDIKGYEGLYQVSNIGRVRNIKTGRILKFNINHRGYFSVHLSKKNKVMSYPIHRLVAIHFLLNSDNLPQVNHKDENKTNNCVDNLEWCNAKYNANYGTRNKKIGNILKNHPNMSYGVIAIKDGKVCLYFPSLKEAERNGFHHSHIAECCKGKKQTHKGYKWMFLEDYLADWWDMEMEKAA